MTNKNLVDSRLRARGYLIDVIRCVIYLARQGIALQGSVNNDNVTQLMLLLGTKDATIKSKLLSDGKKYSHHDVQNELLSIMPTRFNKKGRHYKKKWIFCNNV